MRVSVAPHAGERDQQASMSVQLQVRVSVAPHAGDCDQQVEMSVQLQVGVSVAPHAGECDQQVSMLVQLQVRVSVAPHASGQQDHLVCYSGWLLWMRDSVAEPSYHVPADGSYLAAGVARL